MRRAVTLAIALVLSPVVVSAFDVTSCYQTVPQNETGVLQNDITCDGSSGPNVNLGRGARLELNGHTISGGYIGVATSPGRTGRGTIVGPGEIIGAAGDPFGAAISAAGPVVVRNVTLRNNRRGVVSVYDFAMKLYDVTITDNSAEGISSYFVNLGSQIGPGKGKITGRNLTITDNGDNGIEGHGILTISDSTVSGNGGGIVSNGRLFALKNVDVTTNVGAGILSTSTKRGKLKDGSAVGNGPEGDIAAPVAPRLIASTCEHSVNTVGGGTLGICTGD